MSMAVILRQPEQRWECPACGAQDVTHDPTPHTRYHSCSKLAGLSSPMVPAGTKAKITAVEREDYVGKEVVQLDGNGRPIMSIITEREDGQDCTVLAPVATIKEG